jgi:DNA-binding XRE family transcriptional regulator
MDDESSFGQWLRQTRKANELTQDELAHLAGCAATTLRLIEADKRRPSKQLAQRLAVVLNIPNEDRVAFLQKARTRRTMHNLTLSQSQPSNSLIKNVPVLNLDQAIHECATLLNDPACRLLTIVGPPGSGKTRLANTLAIQVSDVFHDGVVIVPLAQINDPALLTTVILITLGVRERDKYDGEGWLLEYLYDKKLLLILDNFEHLVRGAPLLARMLLQTRSLKILVTSHERLALQAEWLYDLPVD